MYGSTDTKEEYKSYAKARKAFHNADVASSRMEHMKHLPPHNEHHISDLSNYVKTIIFGGLDGITTIFAITAAAAGSNSPVTTILIFGISNLFADGFSMGFSEYVSRNAERTVALAEREREEWEVDNSPDAEFAEMVEIYKIKGFSEEDAIQMVNIISKDPKLFVDMMMVEELGILVNLKNNHEPVKHGIVMFFSFVFFGFTPLLAYLDGTGHGMDANFFFSIAITAGALLILGAIKGYLGSINVLTSSLLMLVNGTITGTVGFTMGVLVDYLSEKQRIKQSPFIK